MSRQSNDKEPHTDKVEPSGDSGVTDGHKRKRDAQSTAAEHAETADRAVASDDNDTNQLHQQKARATEPQEARASATHAAASVVVAPDPTETADDSDADPNLQMALVNSIHDIGLVQQNQIALDEGLRRSSAAANNDHQQLLDLLDESFDEPDESDESATPSDSTRDDRET